MEAVPRREERLPAGSPIDFLFPLGLLGGAAASLWFPLPAVGLGGVAVVLSVLQLLLHRARHRRMVRSARQWQRAASGYESHLVKMRDRLQTTRSKLECARRRVADAEDFEDRARDRLVSDDHRRSVGTLVPAFMHEINNPLAIIGGCAQLLESVPANELKSHRDQVARIRRAAQRCEELVRPFRDYARGPAADVGATSVGASVSRVLALLDADIKDGGVKVIRRISDELSRVVIDPVILDEVLLHLLGNSLEAMSDCQRPRLRVAAARRGEVVELHLSDVGHGVDSALRERIFEPFASTRGEGRGIGLAVAAELLARSDACLRLEDVSPGCRVTLYLPAA